MSSPDQVNHPNGLGAPAPRPASAHVTAAPRIRTRLVWRKDRLAGLGIAVTLIAMWAAVVMIGIAAAA